MHRQHRSGFSVVELVVAVAGMSVGASLLSVAMDAGRQPAGKRPDPAQIRKDIDEAKQEVERLRERLDALESKLEELDNEVVATNPAARAAARQLKDATQVRGFVQACQIWANQNQGRYPLPSRIDLAGSTVGGEAWTKDTSANIVSMMIYCGYVSAELCVSPAEVNPSIKVNEAYEFDQPKAAVKPQDAMWDPAFSVDFRDGKTVGLSYANLQPAGKRLSRWADTFMSTEATWGNRGPEIAGIDRNGDVYTARTKIQDSNTLRIHGKPDRWEGNIGWNDGHITFEETLVEMTAGMAKGQGPAYKSDGKMAPDCVFFDEPDDADGTANLFLSIFVKAAKEPKEWGAIWD